MRIIFANGDQKGMRDEGVVGHEFTELLLIVNMKDGAVFTFPLCNIREVKQGGDQRHQREE